MYRVEINQDEITPALKELAAKLDDMSPIMLAIGQNLEHSTEERYQRGEAPDGSAWAPKSQTTLDAYRRRGQRADPRPLFGTSPSNASLRTSIFATSGPDFVELGTNAIQAAVMQFGAGKGAFGATSKGSPVPWGDIPARPFLGLSDADEVAILETVAEALEDLG
ncbi:MAG: phage virion morphogenesis protein [Pseudomonadota bacterium]